MDRPIEGKHYNIKVKKGAALLKYELCKRPNVRTRPDEPTIPEIDINAIGVLEKDITTRAKVVWGQYEFTHKGERCSVLSSMVEVL